MISEDKIQKIEYQINEEKKTVDFDTREFTIEIVSTKYLKKIDSGENEIFVPEYQRDFVWDTKRQSKLIESITLGLPIPIIFLAEGSDGRLEIVDGSQRIRSIAAFISGELVLEDLEKLTELNGHTFQDLPESRQRKINNAPIRMIVLSEAATEEVRNDLFERINRGSDSLRNMEKRKGSYSGPFTDFIYKLCAKDPDLARMTPLSKSVQSRQEYEELVLRFLAFSSAYPHYGKIASNVSVGLDHFMQATNQSFSEKEERARREDYRNMIAYVKSNFVHGFTRKNARQTSRAMFEAISVGVHLALKDNPTLPAQTVDIEDWMKNREFREAVASERRTHDARRIRDRIEFVRDHLLGRKA